jgi:ketosteroid isomerase-like protein
MGTEAIREALSGFVALKPIFDLKVRKVFRAGDDIALAYSEWTLVGTGPDGETMSMSEQGSDVVRQQPDGSWLFVIDNPYGHADAVSHSDV